MRLMNGESLRWGFGFLLSILLLLGGCSDNDANNPADNPEDPPTAQPPTVDRTSFLQGGDYGVVAFRGVPLPASPLTETLPPFGIYDGGEVDTRGLDYENQLLFPFGGFVSTFGPGVSKIGNAKTDTDVGLVVRLYPNFNVLPEAAEVNIYPLLSTDDGLLCFVTDSSNDTAMLRPYLDDFLSCTIARTGPLGEFATRFSAVEFNVDLGSFPEAGEFNFVFGFDLVEDGQFSEEAVVNDPDRETYALLRLNTNVAEALPLPDNVYAHGRFNPSVNGFGFANMGDASFDLFPKELIASEFGIESVCFVLDGECVSLNPFGIYLTQMILPHDGGNGLCNGYSVAATMLATQSEFSVFEGKTAPSDYNHRAQSAIELNFNDVRQLVAAKHIGQFGVDASRFEETVCPSLRPTDVINMVAEGFNTADPIALIGIYNDIAGHAVTPYALSDEGGNVQRIYVYDNNYPSDMNRYIEVNTAPGAETWRYVGSINANAPDTVYSGFELENPMCPQPLSVYANPEIAIQSLGTTRFVDLSGTDAQVVDAEGRISGADFDARINVNNIPNADLNRTVVLNTLTIGGLSAPANTSGAVFDVITEFLSEGYTLRAQPVSEDSQSELMFFQSSILRPEFTAAYQASLSPDTPFDEGAIQVFRAHQTGRLVTVEQPPAGDFEVDFYITLNDQQYGYMGEFSVDTRDLGTNDAVGVYITANGAAFSVFSYDSETNSNFLQLQAGRDFTWEFQRLNADAAPMAMTDLPALQ